VYNYSRHYRFQNLCVRSILTYQTIRSPFKLKVYNYNIEVALQKTSLPSELALYGLIVTLLRSHKDCEAHGCDFDEIAQPFDEIRACLTCFQAAHRALCIFTPPVFSPLNPQTTKSGLFLFLDPELHTQTSHCLPAISISPTTSTQISASFTKTQPSKCT
jgi:hypothetical protein